VNQDIQQLRLLSIFHYVVAGLAALFACFPILHLVMGLFLVFSPDSFEHGPRANDPMAAMIGTLFIVIASSFILTGWAFAVCVLVAGRNLAQHHRYTFCLVMAALMCMFMPFGTVLGVLTILVLMRPSVKPLFEGHVINPPSDPSAIA
jgi:hypothetical protein